MAISTFGNWVPLVLVLLLVVLFVLLILFARRKPGKKLSSSQRIKTEELPAKQPAHMFSNQSDEDRSLSGGSYLENKTGPGIDYRPVDTKEDLELNQTTPARKNGKPH